MLPFYLTLKNEEMYLLLMNSLDSCGESGEEDSDSDGWEYCALSEEEQGDGEWEYFYEESDSGHQREFIKAKRTTFLYSSLGNSYREILFEAASKVMRPKNLHGNEIYVLCNTLR